MSKIQIISLCWLIFLAAFLLGIYVSYAQIWPYSLLQKIKQFMAGDESEDLSLAEKIENDLNIKPSRHIKTNSNAVVQISENYKELTGLNLNSRRENPKVFRFLTQIGA